MIFYLKALAVFLFCSWFIIFCFFILPKTSVHSEDHPEDWKMKVPRPSFMVSSASPTVASVVVSAEPKELGSDHKDPVASVVVSAEPKELGSDHKDPVASVVVSAEPKELRIDPISCCSIAAQRKLEDLCPKNQDITLQNDACNCVDYMLCKLVVVTALSSNHYEESQDFIGSVHALLPHTEIIVYDLGLKKSQSKTLASYCNTKVRQFDFSKYPEYPDHTTDLKKYAWKPFIIEETSKDYELFLYCDASCRVDANFLHYLPYIMKFPVLPCCGLDVGCHVIRTTHDGMLKYLQMNMTRAELVEFTPTFESSSIVFWANDFVKEQFLPKWVDCAMHIECIAPKGAGLYHCNFRRQNDVYAGCHTFDQSALNAILIRDFTDIFNGVGRIITNGSGIKVVREVTKIYADYIKTC